MKGSQHVTNCAVGITGFAREGKRERGRDGLNGVSGGRGRQRGDGKWMNIYVKVSACARVCARRVRLRHCFNGFTPWFVDEGSLVLSGLTGRERESEMPEAYQEPTPAHTIACDVITECFPAADLFWNKCQELNKSYSEILDNEIIKKYLWPTWQLKWNEKPAGINGRYCEMAANFFALWVLKNYNLKFVFQFAALLSKPFQVERGKMELCLGYLAIS